MSTKAAARPAVGQVQPTWGELVTLVRRRSGRGPQEVAEVIGEFIPTHSVSLQRLEKMKEPPTHRRTRAVAALALLAYGWTDLGTFGLSLDDLPGAWDQERLSDLELRMSRCTLSSAV